jgi:hypothetical protein
MLFLIWNPTDVTKEGAVVLRYKWLLTLGVLVVLAVAGAGAVLAQVQGAETDYLPLAVTQSQPDATRFKTHDDLLAEVGKRVPAFGGMYLSDDNSILYIYLLDQSQKEAAKQAIAEILGPQLVSGRDVRGLQGQYSITQIREWYDRMQNGIWAIPGIVLTDLDEDKNRLEVGVDNMGVQKAVEVVLAKLSIPREAVSIGVRERPRVATHTLQSKIGIMEGGYQIQGDGICTLGFNTDRSGEAGFITAGHCTEPAPWDGGVDGTKFYQPTIDPNNLIGTETIDPPFSSLNNCPVNKLCRLSDSAFLKREPGVARDLGKIAKTVNLGSITVDHNNKFRIVDDAAFSAVGETVYKVGRSTGWTSGTVSDTCIRTDLDTVRILLCQDIAQGTAGSGDSGSPVFRITNSPSPNDVRLLGVLWGANPTAIWYSPIGNVYFDLGQADTWNSCDPGFAC